MTANVSIITKRSEDVMCAPSIALKFTPESNGQKYKNQGIWILEKGKPTRIDITEGASDDSNVEIVSSQLKIGDDVIISAIGGKTKSSYSKIRRGGAPGMFR